MLMDTAGSLCPFLVMRMRSMRGSSWAGRRSSTDLRLSGETRRRAIRARSVSSGSFSVRMIVSRTGTALAATALSRTRLSL